MTEHQASTPIIAQREVAPLPPQPPSVAPPAPVAIVGVDFYAARDIGFGAFFGVLLANLLIAALGAIAGFAFMLLALIASLFSTS